MKKTNGRNCFAIEDGEKRRMGRVWLRKDRDTMIPLGHIAIILDDAERTNPTPLTLEVTAWWHGFIHEDEPVATYNPPLQEREGKRVAAEGYGALYDEEKLEEVMDLFEHAEV